MPTSREERMRVLTGEVPADVAGVVVLCNRLVAAVADVQATLEAKLQTDVPPSVTVGGWFDDLRADLRVRDESIRGLLEVAAAERVNIRADLDAATEERVAIASRLDAVEAKLDQLLARLEAVDAANLNDGARHYEALVRMADVLVRIDEKLGGEVARSLAPPVPETPAPVVIPDPGGEFVEVPPRAVPDIEAEVEAELAAGREAAAKDEVAPAEVPADQDLPIVPATPLDDLADLFADPPAPEARPEPDPLDEGVVDPAPVADDGSAS